jgi:cardiolipin synthase
MASSPKSPTPPSFVEQYHQLSFGQLLNVPNALTLCRLFLIPIFLGMLSKGRLTAALYVFGAAALTDSLDGTVARWFDCRTEIGAILDPFADKLLLLSAFVALTTYDLMPGWLLGVVVIRDVVIVFGYLMISFYADERIPVRPSYLGKTATVFQLACVLGALTHLGATEPWLWRQLLHLTVVITAASGLHYSYRGLAWLSSREPQMFA